MPVGRSAGVAHVSWFGGRRTGHPELAGVEVHVAVGQRVRDTGRAVHGALHAVIVCQIPLPIGASIELSNVMADPASRWAPSRRP